MVRGKQLGRQQAAWDGAHGCAQGRGQKGARLCRVERGGAGAAALQGEFGHASPRSERCAAQVSSLEVSSEEESAAASFEDDTVRAGMAGFPAARRQAPP